MDARRFDALIQSLTRPDSRRGLLRGVGAGGLGAGLAALGLRQDALACKKNGEKCDRKKAEKCCSGTCEKKNGKRQCVKADGAFGCTNQKKSDVCEGNNTPCPNNPNGQCVVDDKKRPFCFGVGTCSSCQTDEACRLETGIAEARCLKKPCAECSDSACVVPPP